MPTYPVRFVGDVGNLAQFAGQIEKSILGAERAINSAFARSAASSTGLSNIRPVSNNLPRNMPGTFLQTTNVEFDRINNAITAQARLMQRTLSGYTTELGPSGYAPTETYTDSFIKELTLSGRALDKFVGQVGRSSIIDSTLLNSQRVFRTTESSLKNLGLAYVKAADTMGSAVSVRGRRGSLQLPVIPQLAALESQKNDVVSQIANIERVYGVNLSELRGKVSSLGNVSSLWAITGGKSQNAMVSAKLTPQVLRDAMATQAEIIDREIAPMLLASLPTAQENRLSRPVLARMQQNLVASLEQEAQLGPQERYFFQRFPKAGQSLQKLGLGAGTQFGTPAFFKAAQGQEFKVDQMYRDYERNIVRVSGSLKDATGIAGQWSYALDHNGNVIKRWSTGLSGARGILSQTGRDFLKVIEWTVATSVVFGTLGAAVRSVGQINTLNEDLQRFSITAKLTGDETQEMFKGLSDIAYQTATPLTELVKAADDIALATRRANQSTKQWRQDILDMARAVGILTNISGLDTVQATDLLTASMKQLGLTASQTIDLLNKATAAAGGQANAITDIVQALGTVSEAAEAANLNVDEQIAAVQVISQVTGKTAADVATAFKNLFGALASTGAEKKLKEFGISVRDAEGNIRPFLEVYKDIADALKTGIIPEGRLNEVLRAISGGPRRAPDAAALLSNITKVYEVSKISASATNEALVANAKILDTNNAKLRQLQVTVDTQVFEKLDKTVQNLTSALLSLAQAFAAVFSAIPAGVIQFAIQLGIILTTATLLGKVFNSIGNSFFISRFLNQGKAAFLGSTAANAATYSYTNYLRNASGVAIGKVETDMLSTTARNTSASVRSVEGFPVGYASWRYGRVPRASTAGTPEQLSLARDTRIRTAYNQRVSAILQSLHTQSVADVSQALTRETALVKQQGVSFGYYPGYREQRLRELQTIRRQFRNLPSLVPQSEVNYYRNVGAGGYGSLGNAFVPNRASAALAAQDEAALKVKGAQIRTAMTSYYQDASGRLFRTTIQGIDQKAIIAAASGGVEPKLIQVAGETTKGLVTATATSWASALGKALKTGVGKGVIGGVAAAGIAGAGLAATGGDQGAATLLQGLGISAAMLGVGTGNPFLVGGGAAVAGLATVYQQLTAAQEDNKKKVLELRQASYESLQQYRVNEAATRAYASDLSDIENSLKVATKGTEAYIGLQHQYGQLLIDNMAATDTLNASFDILKKNLIDMADTAVKAGEQLDSAFQNAINVLKTGVPIQSLTPAIQKALVEGLSRGILDAEGKITYTTNLAPVTGSYNQGLGVSGLTGGGQYGTIFPTQRTGYTVNGTYIVPEGTTQRTIDLLNLTVQDIRDIYRTGWEKTGIPVNNQTYALLLAATEKFRSALGNDFQPIVNSFGAAVEKFGVGIAQMSNLISQVGANAEAARTFGVIGAEDYSNIQNRIDIATRIQNIAAAYSANTPSRTISRVGEFGTSAQNQYALGLNQLSLDPNKLRDIQNKILINQSEPYGLAKGLISEEQAVAWFKEIAAYLPKEVQDKLLSSEETTKAAARQYFSGIVEEAKGAGLSMAEALTIKEDIFSGVNSTITGLNQKLFELEAQKRGGEFKDNIAGYEALKSQYEATKSVLIDFNKVAQEGSAAALNALADKIDDTVTGMDGLVTETLTAQSAAEGASVNWSNFGEILASVASTAGLTGDQITSLGEKLIAAAKAQQILTAASARAVGVLITEAATMGYTAYVAQVMKTSFAAARTGEGYASSQQAQMDLRRIATGTGAFLRGIINDALAALNDLVGRGAGTGFAKPPSSGGGGTTTKNGMDISELDIPEEVYKAYNRDQLIKEAVAKATALQAKIPGAAKEAANDIVSLLYGTKKVMEVRGVREDLLRRALEELADIERKRLEFDAKADLIQRIRVGTGSFAAIANVPMNSQTGVSVGSPQGPITVNLNINGQVLTPAQMTQLADRIGAAIKNQIGNG